MSWLVGNQKKYIVAVVLGVLIAFLNAAPLIVQKARIEIIMSTLLTWIAISLMINFTKIFKNYIVNTFFVSLIIYSPNFVYILNNSIISFVWTLGWVLMSTFLIQYFSKKYN